MDSVKRICLSLLLVLLMLLSTSCRESDQTPSAVNIESVTEETLPYVELKMVLIGSPARDYDQMLEILNGYLLEDLNASLKVEWIGWGDFSNQYPLMLASGEKIDLIYTSSWLGYYQHAQRGAFLALDEIGPEYASISFQKESSVALVEATVNGHIYALPPNYSAYATFGTLVRGDLREAYGIDPIEDIEGYGAYLEAIVENNPELIPTAMYATQTPIDGLYFYSQGLYPLSGDVATNSPYWIDIDDPEGTVVNIVEMESLPEMLAMTRNWYQLGYWQSAVLSMKDNNMMRKGDAASMLHLISSWSSMMVSNPEYDSEYTNFIDQSYKLPYMQDGMAIPVSSDNPERALMLLELLRNDRRYYDLMSYGIEDVHYTFNNEGKMVALDVDGFQADTYCSWGFRDQEMQYDMAAYTDEYYEVQQQIEASAVSNVYTMFKLEIEPIKLEYEAVSDVMQQYYVPLKLGLVDPQVGLEELKRALDSAGIDKVTEEVQRQIDVFRKQHSH